MYMYNRNQALLQIKSEKIMDIIHLTLRIPYNNYIHLFKILVLYGLFDGKTEGN